MSSVFLCHANEDKLFVEPIQLALASAGYEVFFDERSYPPGGDYQARIKAAIDKCDIFVFVASAASIVSGKYTLTELKFARERWPSPVNRVLPVVIGDLKPKELPIYLQATTVLMVSGNIAAETRAAVEKMFSIHKFRIPKVLAISLSIGGVVLTASVTVMSPMSTSSESDVESIAASAFNSQDSQNLSLSGGQNSAFSVSGLSVQTKDIVLAARSEAKKAEVSASLAKDAELAGKVAAEKARNGEPLMKVEEAEGRRYEGEWSDGAPLGFGRVFWRDQSKSIGESFTGQFDGWVRVRGVFEYPRPESANTSAKIRRYEGGWQVTNTNGAGNWHGHGVIIFRDGSVYRGQVNDGSVEGLGQMTYPNGNVTEGVWSNWIPVAGKAETWSTNGELVTKQ